MVGVTPAGFLPCLHHAVPAPRRHSPGTTKVISRHEIVRMA